MSYYSNINFVIPTKCPNFFNQHPILCHHNVQFDVTVPPKFPIMT